MNLIKYIILIGALILSVMLIKNIIGIASVRNRVSDAQKQVNMLENEQNQLRKKLESASSEAFVEEVARDKLGLAKAGETVVVLPDENFLKSLSPGLEFGKTEPEKANWQKWMERFF